MLIVCWCKFRAPTNFHVRKKVLLTWWLVKLYRPENKVNVTHSKKKQEGVVARALRGRYSLFQFHRSLLNKVVVDCTVILPLAEPPSTLRRLHRRIRPWLLTLAITWRMSANG
ncbi:hypothetical protein DEO72_LG7g2736 [Vigna unguiculata]|uniref:Uncharacterized protein n=1 Tax=Vigna unguiculata TaxID=3917 RepID=A0A4D6MMS4_VIGUN|nr:hypothetical protein DEO72_LG7g2736 [Vigna unguiculata]